MPPVSRGLGRLRAIDLAVRVLAPAAAAIVLVVFLGSRAREPRHDLHLVAPARARAGETLPVRAHLYTGLRRPQGASLVTSEVRLSLQLDGDEVASTALVRSHADTLDGTLALPPGREGSGRLVAVAAIDETTVRVERPVTIARDGGATPLVPRPMRALQQASAGPIRSVDGHEPPTKLDVRVRGGACVPEIPCTLAIHVGAPGASISVESTPSVSAPPGATPSAATEGVVLVDVTTHGPEAELALLAHRDGTLVARRAVRLPNALGAARLAPIDPVLDAPARPTLRLLDPLGGCIVDAFRDERWLRTGARTDCAGGDVPPFAALEPGVWRVQARSDPFSADSAAVASFYVRAPGETETDVLHALAVAALARDADDGLARAVRDDPAAFVPALVATASALLASLETDLQAQPTATSSLPAATARFAEERAELRTLTLAALAFAALALALLVAGRGVRAAGEASRILEEAGSLHPPGRVLGVLRAIAVGVSLLLVFAAIAVYLLARG